MEYVMVYGNCDVAVKQKLKFRSNKTANQCLEAPRDASVHAGCSGVSALQLPGKNRQIQKHPPSHLWENQILILFRVQKQFFLLKYFCWHDHPFQMDHPKKGNGETSLHSPAPPAPPTCSGCLCVLWCSPWVCPACGSMFGIPCMSFLLVLPCARWLPRSCWCIWKSKRWSGKELGFTWAKQVS